MQLPEASCVPFVRWALGADSPSWPREDCWGEGTQGIFRLNHPASVWEHVGSGFQAEETTSKPEVPTEPEAAQTLLAPMESRRLGEKQASAAGVYNHPIVVLFPPRGGFKFSRCSSRKLVLFRF